MYVLIKLSHNIYWLNNIRICFDWTNTRMYWLNIIRICVDWITLEYILIKLIHECIELILKLRYVLYVLIEMWPQYVLWHDEAYTTQRSIIRILILINTNNVLV